MLKWTLNGPRQSYLQSEEKLNFESAEQSPLRTLSVANRAQPTTYTAIERRRLKRKSTGFYALGLVSHIEDKEKENHMTSSTPLHSSTRCAASSTCSLNHSPMRKLDSLKDLSNIVPENLLVTPKACVSPKPQNLLKTPEMQVRERGSVPKQYASTLPTFDVEYSPCALIPGQLLALRGVGIADRYFEKPRYLTQDFNDNYTQKNARDITKPQRPHTQKGAAAFREEDSTLSSSKMGDLTLDRMIDAILESTRKERKQPKHSTKSNACHPSTKNMSPTYTPADDPASDLHEFWDTKSEKYQQADGTELTFCRSPFKKMPYNEREVRATIVRRFKKDNLFQLRRQRAVRRKRKMSTKLSASVRNSAQKLRLMSAAATAHEPTNDHCKISADKSADSAPKHESSCEAAEAKNANISPDSGRNSCSDLEDSTLEPGNSNEGSDDTKSSCKSLDATKRRLSFSTNNANAI